LKRYGPDFDALIVHGLWQYPTDAVRIALSGTVPYFVYTHGMLDPWFNEGFPFKHIKKTIFWHARLRRDLDEAAGVIFTTEEEMGRSISAFFPYRWKRIVAPLGIAEPPSDATAQLAAMEAQFPELKATRFLLFFGRIHPKKGCDLLLRAFAKVASEFPDIKLVMAGPGERKYLESMKKIARTGSAGSNVLWTGMLSGPVKWGLLRAADAFVLPSHQENFAIATVEAMAVGTPVLISNRVQIWPEVIRANAGMVDSDSAEGVEHLLRGWLALEGTQRAKFRRAASACYYGRFTAEQAGRSLLSQLMASLRSSSSKISPLGPSGSPELNAA
jgi:glycosyltransferase involved in cell wall biosynthesis